MYTNRNKLETRSKTNVRFIQESYQASNYPIQHLNMYEDNMKSH